MQSKKSDQKRQGSLAWARRVSVAFLALTLVTGATNAVAQCPGQTHNATGGYALAATQGVGLLTPLDPLPMFILPACTSSVPQGNAAGCNIVQTAFAFALVALWTGTGARLADPSGGCSFMCPGGNCFVRGSDGLPVELLGFGVE